ncbi:MAG: hypothetical protein EOO16_21555 [Chitinophagaceae bacterium]|nr:MAG: hypothetical protein EOO16_21555 [Chitinophagaceae bacterium]
MKKPRSKRQTGNTAAKRDGGGRRVGWVSMVWRYMLTFTDWPQWIAILGFVLFLILWVSWRHLIRLAIGG